MDEEYESLGISRIRKGFILQNRSSCSLIGTRLRERTTFGTV